MIEGSDDRANGPSDAEQVMDRIDRLAGISDEDGRITRLAYSPSLLEANRVVLGWMRDAGMDAWVDAAGNLVGRIEGLCDGPALMLGSHLDTVRNGGRFDGMLGVLSAIAVVERLRRDGVQLSFPLEVIAFADEEGVRFGSGVLGSNAVAGRLTEGWAERRDAEGVSLGEAFRAFGLNPDAIGAASRANDPPFAYLELHIEQGPVLEAAGVPVGCVTAIAGQTRLAATLSGKAGHAGTVPMALRQDALAGAAECVLAVERIAGSGARVGTVGQLRVHPNASNVIPDRVTFSVDMRSQEDAVRVAGVDEALAAFQEIAARRGLSLSIDRASDSAAVACSPRLVAAISAAVERRFPDAPRLPSGAGHDGIAMSTITEVGMIFVRCAGGLSHHPDESVTIADIAAGLDVLHDSVLALDRATEV